MLHWVKNLILIQSYWNIQDIENSYRSNETQTEISNSIKSVIQANKCVMVVVDKKYHQKANQTRIKPIKTPQPQKELILIPMIIIGHAPNQFVIKNQ